MGNKLAALLGGIRKFIEFAGRKDIAALQEKYKADKRKVVKILLTDKSRSIAFQVADGAISYELKHAHLMAPDLTLFMTTDTLLNLLAGRIKVRDHRTGKDVYQPYTYADAVRWDDVQFEGEGATNDNRLAMEVFGDTLSEMQEELYPEIQRELSTET
jgi:hypothetical protein